MSKRHSTKYKIDRRMGENIWGRPKSPVNKRSYPPGQHGQNRSFVPSKSLKAITATSRKNSSAAHMIKLHG